MLEPLHQAKVRGFGEVDEWRNRIIMALDEVESKEDQKISLFDILRTFLYFAVLFAGASALGNFIKSQIEKVDELTPSLKALIVKIMNVVLTGIPNLVNNMSTRGGKT